MVLRVMLALSTLGMFAGCGGKASDGTADAGGAGGSNTGAANTGGSTGGIAGSAAGAAGTGGSTGGAGSSGAGGASAGTGGNAGVGGVATDAAVDLPVTTDAGDAGLGDSSGDAVCSPVERPVSGFRPDILVLLDASESMNRDASDQTCSGGCGAMSKWALTVSAVNDVVAMTEDKVNWGLKLFSEGTTSCNTSATVAVPIAGMSAAAIAAAIAGRSGPTGGLLNGGGRTPT